MYAGVTQDVLCVAAFHPWQVSLLEYRKRQREARRSGSKTECSSPVSTVPPLNVEVFPVGLESSSEAPAPTPLCNAAILKEPQMSEEADVLGERGEKEEGQWCELSEYLLILFHFSYSKMIFVSHRCFSLFLSRTSSTSVEQARERSYHRALLLSKDKDIGQNNSECSLLCKNNSIRLLISMIIDYSTSNDIVYYGLDVYCPTKPTVN